MYICKHVYYFYIYICISKYTFIQSLSIYIYNSIMAETSRAYHSSFHAHVYQIRGTMKVVIPWSPSETPAPSGAPRHARSGDSVKRP